MSIESESFPSCETRLTGGQFEERIAMDVATLRDKRMASIVRPGVHALPVMRYKDGTVKARLIASLPDFEGVFGRPLTQVIFDAKVCSKPSFDLSQYRVDLDKPKSRQLKHMMERSDYGSCCFFLIHFNAREMKTKQEPSQTFAMPVWRDHPFWSEFYSHSQKSLSRQQCIEYGVEVPWRSEGTQRILRPDLMFAFERIGRAGRQDRIVGRW